MNRNITFRKLGQKSAKCYNCGRTIAPFSEVLDFAMGGQPRCVCKDCLKGDFRNGKAARNKEVGKADKTTSTKCHTMMVYTFDPAIACAARISHGFSSKKLASGCYRLKYTMKSCAKGGWIFNEEANLDSEFMGCVVNGVSVITAHEYHEVVEAQDWYKRVGE